MEITEELLNRLLEHVKTATPVTRDYFVDKKNLVLVANQEYNIYSNVKSTRGLDSLSKGLVTHFKFFPVKDEGLVIIQAAVKGEDGAVEFHRSRTNRTGNFTMRAPLQSLGLKIQDRRPVLLPLIVIPSADKTQPPLVFVQVKGAPTRDTISHAAPEPPAPKEPPAS